MFDDDGETAIEQAVDASHPGATALVHPFPEGHDTELQDYLAVRIDSAPCPHWLFVSRGFTELAEKKQEDPEISGWGFELTCRVPISASRADIAWAENAMLSVSRYLADKITFLERYNYLPVTDASPESSLRALVVVEDIAMLHSESKNGRFSFFQIVGLTEDEYEAVNEWDAAAIVELIRARNPLLLTEPGRTSLLTDPDFARAVNEGRQRDGSSVGALFGVSVLWRLDQRTIELHLSTEAVPAFVTSMRRRLAHGNSMQFFGDRRKIVRPDGSIAIRSQVNVALHAELGRSAIERADGTPTAVIRLSTAAIGELATMLPATPGTYMLPALANVRFVVVTPERFREPSYPG